MKLFTTLCVVRIMTSYMTRMRMRQGVCRRYVGVNAAAGTVPEAGWRLKDITSRRRHWTVMRIHSKVHLRGEILQNEICGVLISRRRFRHWGLIRMLRQSVEVEFISISLAVDFRHDVFVVIVSQGSTEFVIVHVRLAFPLSPTSCHFVGVY